MLRTILVPLDGSELSQTVLGPLRRLLSPRVAPPGSGRQTSLVLLHVVVGLHGAGEVEFSGAQRWLERTRQQLEAQGLAASVRLARGDPVEQIVASAAALGADLVAMATHGRTGAARLVRGSVAEGVLRRCATPLLLVNPHIVATASASSPLERLLLAHDGSGASGQIGGIAALLARRAGAEVILARIADPVDEGSPEASRAHRGSLERAALALGEGIEARGALAFGRSPAEALLDMAARERVELIAMTTHGRSGLARAWLGSVAEEVVRHAVVPVVVKRTAAPSG